MTILQYGGLNAYAQKAGTCYAHACARVIYKLMKKLGIVPEIPDDARKALDKLEYFGENKLDEYNYENQKYTEFIGEHFGMDNIDKNTFIEYLKYIGIDNNSVKKINLPGSKTKTKIIRKIQDKKEEYLKLPDNYIVKHNIKQQENAYLHLLYYIIYNYGISGGHPETVFTDFIKLIENINKKSTPEINYKQKKFFKEYNTIFTGRIYHENNAIWMKEKIEQLNAKLSNTTLRTYKIKLNNEQNIIIAKKIIDKGYYCAFGYNAYLKVFGENNNIENKFANLYNIFNIGSYFINHGVALTSIKENNGDYKITIKNSWDITWEDYGKFTFNFSQIKDKSTLLVGILLEEDYNEIFGPSIIAVNPSVNNTSVNTSVNNTSVNPQNKILVIGGGNINPYRYCTPSEKKNKKCDFYELGNHLFADYGNKTSSDWHTLDFWNDFQNEINEKNITFSCIFFDIGSESWFKENKMNKEEIINIKDTIDKILVSKLKDNGIILKELPTDDTTNQLPFQDFLLQDLNKLMLQEIGYILIGEINKPHLYTILSKQKDIKNTIISEIENNESFYTPNAENENDYIKNTIYSIDKKRIRHYPNNPPMKVFINSSIRLFCKERILKKRINKIGYTLGTKTSTINNNANGHCFFESLVQAFIFSTDETVNLNYLQDKIQTFLYTQSKKEKKINYTEYFTILNKQDKCSPNINGCDYTEVDGKKYSEYYSYVYLLRLVVNRKCHVPKCQTTDNLFEGLKNELLLSENIPKNIHMNEYRASIMDVNYWADNYAIQVLSDFLEIQFDIYELDDNNKIDKSKVIHIEDKDKIYTHKIILCYSNKNHYELIIQQKENVDEFNTVIKKIIK